ncbi:MAG: DEAD/DEAH box helicase [Archangium sp.]|nr:DEAD/DEAH box helicase [Archangium sp.]
MSAAFKLDDYQIEAVEGARDELRRGGKRCLIVLPTGGGKTVVASEVIHRAMQRQSRVLFLAHRRELILQTSAKLTSFGVKHGIIMGSHPRALQHLVQVASVQTLAHHRDLLAGVDLIFLDEAHHAAAGSYEDILSWFPKAVVVGLTATPWRLDGRGLADIFDCHVIPRTPKQLKETGWLVPVGGWEYEAIDTSRARVQGGDFATKDLVGEASKPRVVGDIVEEWQRHAQGGRTIVFAVSIEISKLLAEKFREAGVPAEHLDGKMKMADRDGVLARLRSGETRVVTNCNVLTEGFDCPALEVCVLARPTLSTSLYLQMVGRVLRTVCFDCGARNKWINDKCVCCGSTNLKRQARIHDHAGCLAAHGHPYAERDYSPETTVKGERESIEDAQVRTVRQKRCTACKSIRVEYPCDNCNYSPTPTELRIEFEQAAHAREIAEENSPQRLKQLALAAAFARVPERGRRAFFDKMLHTRGLKAAIASYRAWSGGTEWPPQSWRHENSEATT